MLTFRDTFTKVNFGPKEGIFILIDNDPQVYKLSCCGSFGLFFSFIQIAFGHAGNNHKNEISLILNNLL